MITFGSVFSSVFIILIAVAAIVITIRVVLNDLESDSDNLSRVRVRSNNIRTGGVVHQQSSFFYDSRNCDL